MKHHPMLYSAPMVRALLDGTKTQTRRTAKLTGGGHVKETGGHRRWHPGDPNAVQACPYGHPGDHIWVRETFFAFGRWETRFSAKKGRDEWHFVDMTLECGRAYGYDEPHGFSLAKRRRSGAAPTWHRRPAIFMPRAASRITLEITGVRVERLQDIGRGDAMAEGCPFPNMVQGSDPRRWYAELWEQLNGPGSGEANPWVWVVEFKRVTGGAA